MENAQMFIEASLNLHVLYQHLKWNFYIQGLSKLLVHYSYIKYFCQCLFKSSWQVMDYSKDLGIFFWNLRIFPNCIITAYVFGWFGVCFWFLVWFFFSFSFWLVLPYLSTNTGKIDFFSDYLTFHIFYFF